jgi:hypothetical protein
MTVMVGYGFSSFLFFATSSTYIVYQGFGGTCCFFLTADTSETSMILLCHPPISLHVYATYEIPVCSCLNEVTAVAASIAVTVLYIFIILIIIIIIIIIY